MRAKKKRKEKTLSIKITSQWFVRLLSCHVLDVDPNQNKGNIQFKGKSDDACFILIDIAEEELEYWSILNSHKIGSICMYTTSLLNHGNRKCHPINFR